MKNKKLPWEINFRHSRSYFFAHVEDMAYGQGRPFADEKSTSWGAEKEIPLTSDITESVRHYLGENIFARVDAHHEYSSAKNHRSPLIDDLMKTFGQALSRPPPLIYPGGDKEIDEITKLLLCEEGFDIQHLRAMPQIGFTATRGLSSVRNQTVRANNPITVRRGRRHGGALEQGWFWTTGKFHVNAGKIPETMRNGLVGYSLDRVTGQPGHKPLIIQNVSPKAERSVLVLGIALSR